jgi:hypothetical protein
MPRIVRKYSWQNLPRNGKITLMGVKNTFSGQTKFPGTYNPVKKTILPLPPVVAIL